MDCSKVGALLLGLRKEKGMTQKQVADKMNISDKTISKWERGLGCPDISLLSELSNIFEIDIEEILDGAIEANPVDSGNFRRIKFYVCPDCENIISNTGNSKISCCGRKLSPLVAKAASEMHDAVIEDTEGEYYITFTHEMSKTHYISFVAYVTTDRVLLIKLYPEQTPSVRLPKLNGGKLKQRNGGRLYYYCNRHGLWVV
ncbi:XRE family transcriptional regulator [Anaerocolumna cellulosilytica]|uniref:XRE family transcriptional regulator n=1 Tax=Anaerocolumna cellulosilytica TaxID=433286 RepID=A0A6S6QXU7_9FIRM|nr:helix-turn-helix domain-containing protein [Anaerocolumna cellulosilytica]MBB5195645.1 transcriptional regulator with XRE-family HTH domain [Anaerocolumna cellulosilytica]BCJ93889.1 XRE family transcriptional regulator [Anaerocolumna cellulosilytica]